MPASAPLATAVPPVAEAVPIYPHAREVTHDLQGAPQKQTIVFKTDDSQATLDFYQAALEARGWVKPLDLTRQPTRPPRPTDNSDTYFWADPTGQASWKLMLTIDFWVDSGAHITIERWPVLDKMPIYPGAQQVATHVATTGS
ncbi:MAG TPA: hypothetical protein VKY74_22930, partial [Chloroflexia bacterium]|nr:hypothetical protein [Chloroflexia bacterium]